MFITFNKIHFLRKPHNIIQAINSLLLLIYILSFFLKIKIIILYILKTVKVYLIINYKVKNEL